MLFSLHKFTLYLDLQPFQSQPEIKVRKVSVSLLNDNTCAEVLYWTLKNGNSFFSEALFKPYSLDHYKRNQCGLEPCNHHHSPAAGIEPVLLPLLLTGRTVRCSFKTEGWFMSDS